MKSEKDQLKATEDELSDGLPPPYEEYQETSTSDNVTWCTVNVRPSDHRNKTKVHVRRHEKPLIYYTPDPANILCRCGQHVDTTKRSWLLPMGTVRCQCGYVVTSTGYSCHASQYRDVSKPVSVRCKCEVSTPERMQRNASSFCECGGESRFDGSTHGMYEYHKVLSHDARNIQCDCGLYVDTTGKWVIRHGSITSKEVDGPPLVRGYSSFDYTLPEGCGRCLCGMTVRKDGACVLEHTYKCCRILSHNRRKAAAGSVRDCSFAYIEYAMEL